MKKRFIFGMLLGLLLPITTVFAHYDRSYWHEEKETTQFIEQYTEWMSTIPDDRKLSQLSIPGTHDTMAHRSNLPFLNIVRTQTMDLKQQLNSGIRYLDIRIAYHQDYFELYHGAVKLRYRLEDVFEIVKDYLTKYPSETILMRIKQEHTHANDLEMKLLFDKYYKKYQSLFWDKNQSIHKDNPTLKEIRGKIVLLPDVFSIDQGINYRSIVKQDQYNLRSNWDLYNKWEAIKKHLNVANTASRQLIFMNYLSGSGGAMPYFVASGHVTTATKSSRLSTGLTEPLFRNRYPEFPRLGKFGIFSTIYFEGMNTLTADYLINQSINRAGIVVADFPGEKLIDAIIQVNYRK